MGKDCGPGKTAAGKISELSSDRPPDPGSDGSAGSEKQEGKPMKKPKNEPIYICDECGKEIIGDHVQIITRRRTEQHIHYGCMPGRRRDSHGETNTER